MKKISIKIPLSSANLGCGFDTFGLALSLYNTYVFEENDIYKLEGFKSEFIEKNLCLEAYLKVFELKNKKPIVVKISLKQNIPNCGGLGSSANVIIAGVMGANYMMGNIMTKDEICEIASMIEGHPDNVVPEIFGGLTSAINEENKIKYFKYNVSNDLIFTILAPSFSLNTSDMRRCLPETVSLKDAIYNLSRSANTPISFINGDFESLKYLLKDKLHEQYRISKIKGANVIFEWCMKNNIISLISGSGASLLLISQNKVNANFEGFKSFQLCVDNEGVKTW